MTQKYGAALISIAPVAFAFLKIALADSIDPAEVAQLVALVVGAVAVAAAVYIVLLLTGPWAGGLKTGGVSILAAAAAAIAPFLLQCYITPDQWTVDALAVLGVEVGVSARTTIDAGTYTLGEVATITSLEDGRTSNDVA